MDEATEPSRAVRQGDFPQGEKPGASQPSRARRASSGLALALAALLVGACAADALASGRFEVGARLAITKVIHDHKEALPGTAEGFVGSLNHWDPEGPSFPFEPFVGWYAVPGRIKLELSYNALRVVGESDYPTRVSRDGVFVFRGPMLAVVARLSSGARLAPYFGIGVTYSVGGFDADPWWAEGFGSQREYEQRGPKSPVGKTRSMRVGDGFGYAAVCGVELPAWKNVFLDLRAEYQKHLAEVSFSSFIRGTRLYERGPFEVRFDNLSVSFGLGVRF